ncbi:hypothetical protein OROMI_023187 [Orobanche minor]
MRLQILPRCSAISAIINASSANNSQSQVVLNHKLTSDEFVSKLLSRRWALESPDAKINQIMISERKEGQLNGDISFHNITQPCLSEGMIMKKKQSSSFYVVRDDLLHPLINGNKARKLDALLPILEHNAVTDVVTCGGCQSAHAAAVAVSCAERGINTHLLLRGEEPETLTGYNLVSKLYGNVVYVPRTAYAKREEMLARHAESVVGHNGSIMWLNDIMGSLCKTDASEGQNVFSEANPNQCLGKSKKVVVINEGAGDGVALLA